MSGNPSGKTASNPIRLATPAEQRREAERMRNVFFLLDNLFKREEATIKLILDCLYDVGSVNYINQKLARKPLNRILKWLAWFPKPIFRIVAMRWVKKNAPELVVRWLHRKVKFAPAAAIASVVASPSPSDAVAAAPVAAAIAAPAPAVPLAEPAAPALSAVVEPAALPPATLAKLDTYQYEIRRLHSQVNVLATLLVTVTLSLGGAFAWLLLRTELTPVQTLQPIRPAIAQCIDG